MQLTRLTTVVTPGLPSHRKTVDIGTRLHPQGMPEVVDFPMADDVASKLCPPDLQPIPRAGQPPVQPDIASALNPLGQPAPAPLPAESVDFQAALNPPDLQPIPEPRPASAPVNIRQILDSPQGLLAENMTGTLTHFF